jgi:hypothetical protein
MIKEINQNPERYKKVGNSWVISASKDIKPIELPIGSPILNLKPVINANGIIVKAGGDYLCSLETLNSIKESNNLHYDIVENGKITIKDKEVVMGKTIKIIQLDITKLEGLADGMKIKSSKAGVSDTEFIYEGSVTNGISDNLIQQINYTLTQDGERGSDNYSLYKLKLAPDEAYSVEGLKSVSQDDSNNGLLDTIKLRVFTEGVNDRLKLLREDFNMIKRMFFDGEIPTNDGKVSTSTQIKDPLQRYSEIYDDNHQVVYKEVGGVQSFRNQIQDALGRLTVNANILKSELSTQQQRDIELQQALQQTSNQNSQVRQQLESDLEGTRRQLQELQKALAPKED